MTSPKATEFKVVCQQNRTRTGIFQIHQRGTDAPKTLKTPCCILGSKLGAPPNFTLDIWNDFKQISNAVQIGMGDL
jgi:hypothetical protein